MTASTPITVEVLCGALREQAYDTGDTISCSKAYTTAAQALFYLAARIEAKAFKTGQIADRCAAEDRKASETQPATKRHDWTQATHSLVDGGKWHQVEIDKCPPDNLTLGRIYADTASEARLRANAAMRAEELVQILDNILRRVRGTDLLCEQLCTQAIKMLESGT